jgi:uncharacterized phosphatase
MTKFYILRHGETEWNHNNRYCGRTDIPLSCTGIKQVNAVSQILKGINFAKIYSSPLIRAKETARLIKGNLSLTTSIEIDERLIEIDFGRWEGKTKSQIQNEFPELWLKWTNTPSNTKAGETGETANEAYNRVYNFYHEKAQQYPNENILVVAHNTLNRIFIAGTLGLPFSKYRKLVQSNTGISILEINKDNEFIWYQVNSFLHISNGSNHF